MNFRRIAKPVAAILLAVGLSPSVSPHLLGRHGDQGPTQHHADTGWGRK